MAGELDFDEFYDASFRRVVGQVFAMVGSLTEAEDSVQERIRSRKRRTRRLPGTPKAAPPTRDDAAFG